MKHGQDGATNLSRTSGKQATAKKLLRIWKDYTSMPDCDVTPDSPCFRLKGLGHET